MALSGRVARHVFSACFIVAGLLAQPLVSPASAMEVSRAVNQLYTDVSAYPPKSGAFTLCYGFQCRRRLEYAFTATDRSALASIMAGGKGSAAAERAAAQRAVVWFDKHVGPMIGTNKRVARADFRAGSDATNYDCWDTTRNTTALLLVLQDWGLFRYHTVGDPRYRGNALVGQTPHNTAILIDKATRVEWVVDLWTRGYGQTPEVMPADEWVKLD
ncbi:hypothetical protein [Bradyrhizobium sp. 2TAF24]|uniref:hypothetical protein n=1 Tax=Bradyrhizobium sp. 2TAF24 TaxID=3233011 RepID=UPI003F902200